MATRTMIFGFIRVMAIFVREHGNSERLLDALVMVKLLPTLKRFINVNSQKSFIGLWMYLKWSTGLLMSFHGYSCPSIMIICIQLQTWGARIETLFHHDCNPCVNTFILPLCNKNVVIMEKSQKLQHHVHHLLI